MTRFTYDLERQAAIISVPLGGPFGIVYRTDRVRGYTASLSARVALLRETVPPRLRSISVTTSLDGHRTTAEYEPTPHAVHAISTDEPTRVGVRAEYVFEDGSAPMRSTVSLGAPDPRPMGLGGFVLAGLPVVDGATLLLASGRSLDLHLHEGGQLLAIDRGIAYVVRDGTVRRAADAITGRTLWQLTQDGNDERLTGPDGSELRIMRDNSRLTLEADEQTTKLDTNGWITNVTNDAGDATLNVDSSGLLTELHDGRPVACNYDANGRLSDVRFSQRHIVFRREEIPDGFRVAASDGNDLDERIEVRTTDEGLVRVRRCCGQPPIKVISNGSTTTTERPDGSLVRHVRDGAETRTTVTLPSGAQRTWRRYITRQGDIVESGLEHNGELWLTRMDVASGDIERHTPSGRVARSRYEDGHETLHAAPDGTWQAYEWDGQRAMSSHGTLGEFTVTFERDGRASRKSVEGSTVVRRTADTVETILPSGISIVDRPSDDGRAVEIGGGPYVSLRSTDDLSEIRHDGRTLASITNEGPAARMSLVSESELSIEQNGDGVVHMRGANLRRSVQLAGGRVVAAASGDNTIVYRWDGRELEGFATSGLVSGDVSIVRSDAGVIESVTIADSTFPLGITEGAITRLGPLEIQLDDDALRPRRITAGRIEEEWTYDNAGRLSERAVLVQGERVFAHRVERDKAARIVRQRIDGPAPTDLRFEYEGGHLVEVSGDRRETFRYDERGRLTALNSTAVPVSSAGSPLAIADHPVAMTDGGRISRMTLSGVPVDLGYNGAGEVTTITTDAGTTTMTRDAFGRSIEIDDGTHVRRLLWDDAGPVALFDDAGSVIERYLRPPGSRVPEMVIRGDTVLRLVSDQIGSPVALIDTESGAVEQFHWSAYGELISGPEGFLFGFAGSVVLNARPLIVDLGVRTYIPAIGRWAQWDPLLHGGGGTDLYGYSANDPVNRHDPTGAEVKYCVSARNVHGFLKTDKGEFGQDFGTGPPPWWPQRDMAKFFAGGSRWWRIFTRWGPQYKDDDPSQGPRSGEDNTLCVPIPPWLEVDEDCVNERTKPGTYAGTYLRPKIGFPGLNVCHTVAFEVLQECSTGEIQKLEQFAKDLLEDIAESECCGAGATPQPPPDGSLTGGAKGGETGNPRQEPHDGIIWPPHG